jgi:hypothetical protein
MSMRANKTGSRLGYRADPQIQPDGILRSTSLTPSCVITARLSGRQRSPEDVPPDAIAVYISSSDHSHPPDQWKA